jgi:hypothetical protein
LDNTGTLKSFWFGLCPLLLALQFLAGCGSDASPGIVGTGTAPQGPVDTGEPEAVNTTGETDDSGSGEVADSGEVAPAEVAVSPEYSVSTSIFQNVLVVADNHNAIAAWVAEAYDRYSLNATIANSTGWLTATTLSDTCAVSVVAAASAQTAMVAWQQRAYNAADLGNSEIRARILQTDGWRDVVVAGTPAS